MNARLTTLVTVLMAVTVACTTAATQTPGPASPLPSVPVGSATPPPSATATPGSSGEELAMAAVPRIAADPADALKAAQGMNAFGIDLYHRVATGTKDVVISPASIALALAMVRAGARGETATQMDAVMRSIASDDHASWMNALAAALAARTGTFKDAGDKDASVTLRIANAPFAQRGMTLAPTYLDALAGRFSAGLRLVDFMSDPEAARLAIDGWVSDQTEARIPELLAKGSIDESTRLVLVNAIYLKAAWLTPFDPKVTKPGTFTKLDGATIQVPTMASDGPLRHAAGDGWRAAELPYVGGQLAMTIILPDDIKAFEAGLSAAAFDRIIAALTPGIVDLTLPRFGIETQAQLAGPLAALGMPLAFSDQADFSGITTEQRLMVSKVVHQANIDVDESGTTAAAATAAVMDLTSGPAEPFTMHVDRPFLFVLRDTQTGAILFLGRVMLPATR